MVNEVKIEPNTESYLILKEFERRRMISGLLVTTQNLLDEPSEVNKKRFGNAVVKMITNFVESGGTGSEAITRLMGLGFLDEFPKIEEFPVDDKGCPKDEIEIRKTAEQGYEIETTVFFTARPPDKQGRETWKNLLREPTLCKAKLLFKFNPEKARQEIEKLGPEIADLRTKL